MVKGSSYIPYNSNIMKRALLFFLTCIFTSFAFAQDDVDIEELKQFLIEYNIYLGKLNAYNNYNFHEYNKSTCSSS